MQFSLSSFWSQGRSQVRWRRYVFLFCRQSASQEKICRKVSSYENNGPIDTSQLEETTYEEFVLRMIFLHQIMERGFEYGHIIFTPTLVFVHQHSCSSTHSIAHIPQHAKKSHFHPSKPMGGKIRYTIALMQKHLISIISFY